MVDSIHWIQTDRQTDQGGRKIYRSEVRLFSSAISPTFLLSLIFQLQMSFHLLYALCALRKTCKKKKTCFRRNHDFQIVKQKSSDALESAMTVETAQDWKRPTRSATKKCHPLGNIWFRVFFLKSHENKGDGPFFRTNSCIVAVSCDKRGRFEQSTSWISPISDSTEHSFWSRTRKLKAKWMMS